MITAIAANFSGLLSIKYPTTIPTTNAENDNVNLSPKLEKTLIIAIINPKKTPSIIEDFLSIYITMYELF
jgi:hypothetical protein